MRSLAILATSAVLVASPAPVRAETAREILDAVKAVNEAREPRDVSQTIRMTIVDGRGGERVRDLEVHSKRYGEDTTKAITFFLSPPDVKGVGFLAFAYPDKDDDQWLWLPELKRVRRITANTRRQSFQGSDFSYQDLELFEEVRDWTEEDASAKVLAEEETVDGVPAVKIELVPRGKDLEYERFVLWIHRPDATVRKMEFYDRKDGALIKVLTMTDFRPVGRVPTPHELVMANVKKKSKTVMHLADVKYDTGIADDVFTERTLERGKVR